MPRQTMSPPARTSVEHLSRSPGGSSIAQRLGFNENARLLIIHADDLGLAHSVNKTILWALDHLIVSSASVMVPCPWFMEVVEYATEHERADLGIHLTLTSEWEFYRWGPIAPRNQVSTLLDQSGYFHTDYRGFLQNAKPEEVEIEIRAQIDMALRVGMQPTHIDSHMLVLLQSPKFWSLMVNLAAEYRLPCLTRPGLRPRDNDSAVLDSLIMADERVTPSQWERYYLRAVESLTPGLHQLVVHLGRDNSELRAITKGHLHWNAGWRQRDLDVMRSQRFRSFLEASGIRVVDWNLIRSAYAYP
jgi:chitin disaccharide deacetylase